MKKTLLSASLALSLAAGAAPAYRFGLWTAKLNANCDWTTKVSSFTEVTGVGPAMAHAFCNDNNSTGAEGAYYVDPVSGTRWEWNSQNTTFVYSGYMYFVGGETYIFGKSIDDGATIVVNGTTVIKDGTWNNFATGSYTPAASGWLPVEIRVGDGSSGKGPWGQHGWDKTIGLGYNTNGLTACSAPAEDGGIKLIDDGSGALFRAAEASDFFTLGTIAKTTTGYSFTVTAAAPGTGVVHYGATKGAVEDVASWDAKSSAVTFAADALTQAIEIPWSDSTPPYFAVEYTGADAKSRFLQWSDPGSLVPTPAVSASVAATTSGSVDFTVALSFPVVVQGDTLPDIAVTAYYGAADAGATATGWDLFESYGDKTAGSHTLTLSNLAAGIYYVRFAVKTADSETVWSEPLCVNTAGIYLDAPASIAENYPGLVSFSVCRPATATDNAVTVNLTYSGATASVTVLPASVTLAAGEASVSVVFKTIDNSAIDGEAALTVTIAPDAAYTLGSPSSAEIAVIDDESVAREIVWTGLAGDRKWETAGNWSPERVPTLVDTAVFPWTNSSFDSDRTVTISTDAGVRLLRLTSGDDLKLTGSGSLRVGGIDRGDSGYPWKALSLELPVHAFATEGVTSVWNTAEAEITVNAQIVAETPGMVIRKTGGGKLNFNFKGQGYGGSWHLAGGKTYANEESSMRGDVALAGDGVAAELVFNKDQCCVGGVNCTVYDKGKLYADRNHWSGTYASTTIWKGGYAKFGWFTCPKVFFHGGELDSGGGDYVTCWPMEFKVFESDATAFFRAYQSLNWWDDQAFTVERGTAPVDLVHSGGMKGDNNVEKTVKKTGTGIMKVTGKCDTTRTIWIQGGTWLADHATSGCTHDKVYVQSGATLGGVGAVVGSNCEGETNVIVSGSGSTVAPGSIDVDTGDHVFGTLTVGSDDCVNGVDFGANTKLLVTLGGDGAIDSLVVHGTISVATGGTELEVAVEENARVRAGVYVVASATEGISGAFGTVTLPRVSGAPHLTLEYSADGRSILLTVPPRGTNIAVR